MVTRYLILARSNPYPLYMFVKRSMDKFRSTGSKARKEGSGGYSSINRQAATCIKRLEEEEQQEGGGHGGGIPEQCHELLEEVWC